MESRAKRASARSRVARGGLLILLGAIASLTVPLSLSADDSKVRNWKDKSGKFEIKATLVQEKNGVVTLKQEDGEEMEIDLDQLSTLDQNFIRSQAGKSPFKKKGAASPFRNRGTRREEPKAATPRNSGGENAVDWSGATLVQTGNESRWDAIEITPTGATAKKGVALPKKRDFFEKLTGMVVGEDRAIVGYKLESRGGGEQTATTRLVICDLAGGRKGNDVIVDGNYALLDVSPESGNVLVKKDVWGFGNQDEIEIWSVDGDNVEPQAVLAPFDGENGPAKDVAWSRFVDDSHVLVMNGHGKLGLVDTGSRTADYVLTVSNQSAAALSPDRKYLAVASGKDVQILEAATGESLAAIPAEIQAFPGLAFSADGTHLCLQSSERVISWSLKDGSVYRDIVLSGLNFHATNGPVYPASTHVLVGGTFLIDLEKYVRLWQYSGAESAAGSGNQAVFCVGGANEAGALVPVTLPHQAAVKTLDQALKDPNFFVVFPGTSVRIDVSRVLDGGEQQKVREALAKRVADAGLKVEDNAAITLQAAVENKGTEQMTFREFGSFGEKDVTVTKYLSSVAFQVNGQTAWQAAAMATPHFVNRNENESIEQAIQRVNKPNYAYFQSVGIPTYVMKPLPNNQATLGLSNVTASGLR